VVFHIG
jgi:hypothetical protein